MINSDKREYLPFPEYEKWGEAFGLFVPIVLFSLAGLPQNARLTIICRFIARAQVTLKGIFHLWKIEGYQDCWILHRCMLDRLFHLNQLITKGEFELFDDWSFFQQYIARNKVRSDKRFQPHLSSEFFRDTTANKQRYRELLSKKPQWERPFPEEVAKRMKLDFLYKYGYDYASTLVHPMSNDGEFDFTMLTGLGNKAEYPNQFAVIHNSCLVAFLVLQEGMTGCGCGWRKIVNTCLDDFLKFLETGSKDYEMSLAQIINLGPEVVLCKMKDGG